MVSRKIAVEETKRTTNRKSWIMRMVVLVFFVLAGAGTVVIWSISVSEHVKLPVSSFEVVIEKEPTADELISKREIDSLVRTDVGLLQGLPMNQVNVGKISDVVRKHPAVESVEVVMGVDGVCRAKVVQRVPLFRVLNADASGFYVDRLGQTFPILEKAVAYVPVFIYDGQLNLMEHPCTKDYYDANALGLTHLDEMIVFANFLKSNDDLRDWTEHVHITQSGEFEVIPRVGDQVIDFGSTDNLEMKTKLLFQFYRSEVARVNIEKYDRINLNFEHQVVCELRGAAPVIVGVDSTSAHVLPSAVALAPDLQPEAPTLTPPTPQNH